MQRTSTLHCLHEIRLSDPPRTDLYLYLHTAPCRHLVHRLTYLYFISPIWLVIQLGTHNVARLRLEVQTFIVST